MKKKILFFILALIIIAIIALVVIYFYCKNRVNIVTSLNQKMEELNSVEECNMYIKQTDQEYGYMERYLLNDSEKIVSYYNDVQTKYTDVIDSSLVYSYLEDSRNGNKLMCIANYDDVFEEYLEEDESENEPIDENTSIISKFVETIEDGFDTKISTTNIDGKECYVVEQYNETDRHSIIYVDKKTYTPYKLEFIEDGKIVVSIEYKYDVVTEDDVKPLNTKEYILVTLDEFNSYNFTDIMY